MSNSAVRTQEIAVTLVEHSSAINADRVGEKPRTGAHTCTSNARIESDSLDSINRIPKGRGVAYIYGNKTLHPLEEAKQVVDEYTDFFRRELGLKTVPNLAEIEAMSGVANETSDKPPHVCVVLYWTSDMSCNLCGVLYDLQNGVDGNTPKLLIFCRELEGTDEDNSRLYAADKDSIDRVDDWQSANPNTFLIYKAGDENNMKSFLSDLLQKIIDSEDAGHEGRYACISDIVPSTLAISNTKKKFHCKSGLINQSLRIEARAFNDCLMRNDSKGILQSFAVIERSESEDYTYENQGNGRGLIISNEVFSNLSCRRGTRIDAENLKDLFENLGYKIDVEHDKTADEMKALIAKFASRKDHGSSAMLAILTHGSAMELFGTDGNSVGDEDIIDIFGNSAEVANKPRLLILNACRNSIRNAAPADDDEDKTESVSVHPGIRTTTRKYGERQYDKRIIVADNSPMSAGLIVAHATSHGDVSRSIAYCGSRFIHAMCTIFYLYAAQEDVVTMISKVNFVMTHVKNCDVRGDERNTEKQLSCWTVQTTKKFYLVKTKLSKSEVEVSLPAAELKCSFVILGCRFQTKYPELMSAHYRDSNEFHAQICASEKEDNDRLKEEVASLSNKVEKLQGMLASKETPREK